MKKFKRRLLLRGVIVLLGIVALAAFLLLMQTRAAELQQQKTCANTLDEVEQTLTTNAETVRALTENYNEMNQSMLISLGDLFEQGRFDALLSMETVEQCAAFAALRDTVSAELLVLCDAQGSIRMGGSRALLGQNFAALVRAEDGLDTLFTKDSAHNGTALTAPEAEGTAAPRYKPVYAAMADGSMDGCFYSTALQTETGTYYLVLGEDAALLNDSLAELVSVAGPLDTVGAGSDSFAFAVDKATGTFRYYNRGAKELTGESCESAGLQSAALADGFSGVQNIGGVRYFCVSRGYSSAVFGDLALVSAIPVAALNHNREQVVGWAVIAFLLVTALLVSYTTILRNESLRTGKAPKRSKLWRYGNARVYFNDTIGRKTMLLFVVGCVLVFGVSMYTQTLMSLVNVLNRSDAYVGEVGRVLDANTATAAAISAYCNEEYESKAKLVAAILENAPELVYTANPDDTNTHPRTIGRDANRVSVRDGYGNPVYSVANSPALQTLCEHNLLDELYVFNENAEIIAANNDLWYFTLSTNPDDQSYELRTVLDGKADTCVQEAQFSDMQEIKQYVASVYYYYTYRAEDGSTAYAGKAQYEAQRAADYAGPAITRHRGLVEIGIAPERFATMYNLDTLDYILEVIHMDGDTDNYAFWPEYENVVLCSPDAGEIGKTAAEIGVGEQALSGDYCGFARVGGETCFQRYSRIGAYIIATSTPTEALYRARNGIALMTTLVSGIFLLLLAASLVLETDATAAAYRSLYEQRDQRRKNRRFFTTEMPSGDVKRVTTAESRWDGLTTKWGEKSPEQKFALILRGLEGLSVALIFAALLYGRERPGGSVILTQLLGGAWGRGINIFAFTACGALLICVSVFSWLAKRLLRIVSSTLGARAETIGKLLESVVSYGSMLVGVFYCLYLLGFDSATLLASAGILSLVVGLGAQKLIGDILAGMFIVFEGEFRVGDIVTVDGFCGQVMEIGLRTTKVEDRSRNIQIMANSDIKKVLNMTKETSMAYCDINLDYSVTYAQIEAVCDAELPGIKKRCKEIIEGPYLRGINSLNDSGVEVSIGARCNELDRGIVNRVLRREMLEICRKYGIRLAAPRREISNRDAQPPQQNPLLRELEDAAAKARAEGRESKENRPDDEVLRAMVTPKD